MDVEEALNFADKLVFSKVGKHLSTLQETIFRGAWIGKKYELIAEESYCSDSHIKMVGATLWDLLSQGLEERVSKKTFRAALERQSRFYNQYNYEIIDKVAPFSAVKVESVEDIINLVPVKNELTFPEGQVELNSPFYVERPPIEVECNQTILKPGSLIRIKAPSQMGKTSLTARILSHGEKQGFKSVYLNIELADSKIFQDLDLFLKWFCASVSRTLNLPNKVREYWDDIFGSKTSCKDYFENYLLAEIEEPLILALDRVDSIFPYPNLADDFFALLRAWHEEAKNSQVWKKLRLILVHSTEVYIPLNINQSPFNVGLPIELPEFTPKQVSDLVDRYGLKLNFSQIKKLMEILGGHPYLIRVALYYLAKHNLTLEKFLYMAPTEEGAFNSHLRRHLIALGEQPELGIAFQQVINSDCPVSLPALEMFKLHSMGLVAIKGNKATPYCELYRQYFREMNGI